MNESPIRLIDDRLAEIDAEQKALENERAQLIQAKLTLARLVSRPKLNDEKIQGAPKTQKEFTIHVLRHSATPWFENINTLCEAVKAVGKDIPMTSFQPLVSQMTAEGIIERDGRKLALAERVGHEV